VASLRLLRRHRRVTPLVDTPSAYSPHAVTHMRDLLVGLVLVVLGVCSLGSSPAQAQQVRITGAGASFPFPLYSAWFRKYNRITPGVRISYQSIGSGAGVRALLARTVDFGASDAAMTDAEIAQVDNGVVILPMTAGEIVLAYNLPGIEVLRLPREIYPLLFTGDITRWNDPASSPRIQT